MKNTLELIIGIILLPLLTIKDLYQRLTKQNIEPWDEWDGVIYTLAFIIFVFEVTLLTAGYLILNLWTD